MTKIPKDRMVSNWLSNRYPVGKCRVLDGIVFYRQGTGNWVELHLTSYANFLEDIQKAYPMFGMGSIRNGIKYWVRCMPPVTVRDLA